MRIEIDWNGETTSADLADGRVSVGGALGDGICLPGMPAGLLELTIDGERVVLQAQKPLKVGAALFPAHVERLLVAGESVGLPEGAVLRRPADQGRQAKRRDRETRFVARALLQDLAPAPLDSRAATLTCVTGVDVGAVFPLAFAETTLGRAMEVDLQLHDRSVSRAHARVVRRDREFLIEDLKTTNGVYVNGLQVKGYRRLTTGDIVELGHTVLRFDGPERAPQELTRLERPRRRDEEPTTPEGGLLASVPVGPAATPTATEQPEGPPVPASCDDVFEPAPEDLCCTGTEPASPGELPPGPRAATERLPRRPGLKRRRPSLDTLLAAVGLVLAVAGVTVVVAMLHQGA